MTTMHEPTRTLPVRGEYDAIVCSGGLGGVAAAVASRNGTEPRNTRVADIQAALT